MKRAKNAGIRFNPDKCIIACNKLPFLGHILNNEALKLDPKKAEEISNMDPSTTLTDLQTFLGMLQFLSRFTPNLASESAVLWDLNRKSSSGSGRTVKRRGQNLVKGTFRTEGARPRRAGVREHLPTGNF
jgi:hypothetical protein